MLLIAAPVLESETARRWIIAAVVVPYGYAAIGNAVASRSRHVGWWLWAWLSGSRSLACRRERT